LSLTYRHVKLKAGDGAVEGVFSSMLRASEAKRKKFKEGRFLLSFS
jgi:hypothetical protein